MDYDLFTEDTLAELLAEMDRAQDEMVERGMLKPSQAKFAKGMFRSQFQFIRERLRERGLTMAITYPMSRVGSGEVTPRLARELRKRGRECGRPKTTPGPCSLEVEAWADGCRHHLTGAERDAQTIAIEAWRMGSEQAP